MDESDCVGVLHLRIMNLQYSHTKHQAHHMIYVLMYSITFDIDNARDVRYNMHNVAAR